MNSKTETYVVNELTIEITAEQDAMLNAMYKKEIAALYGLPAPVFCRRLINNGLVFGRGYLSKVQIIQIYTALGWPTIRRS
jgi:hypothetical protein